MSVTRPGLTERTNFFRRFTRLPMRVCEELALAEIEAGVSEELRLGAASPLVQAAVELLVEKLMHDMLADDAVGRAADVSCWRIDVVALCFGVMREVRDSLEEGEDVSMTAFKWADRIVQLWLTKTAEVCADVWGEALNSDGFDAARLALEEGEFPESDEPE